MGDKLGKTDIPHTVCFVDIVGVFKAISSVFISINLLKVDVLASNKSRFFLALKVLQTFHATG